jgi:hypothetical protein
VVNRNAKSPRIDCRQAASRLRAVAQQSIPIIDSTEAAASKTAQCPLRPTARGPLRPTARALFGSRDKPALDDAVFICATNLRFAADDSPRSPFLGGVATLSSVMLHFHIT